MNTSDTQGAAPVQVAAGHAADYGDWDQHKWHNERIYWNLELFFKVTLAIAAAFALLAAKQPREANLLLAGAFAAGGFLELVTGATLFLNIRAHSRYKSNVLKPLGKITLKRWERAEFYIPAGMAVATLVVVIVSGAAAYAYAFKF